MTPEDYASIGFMLIGLAFFSFMMIVILRDDRQSHERRIMERREFGDPAPSPSLRQKLFTRNTPH